MPTPSPESRKISSLLPHPNQHFFGDLPENELLVLAESIRENGLFHPIQILPDGTIVSGHQRVRACGRLEWVEIPVEVLTLDEEQARVRMVRDNLDRRQMGVLARARAIKYLMERERTKQLRRLDPDREPVTFDSNSGRLRDTVARELGISGRSVARALKLLELPQVLQDAVDSSQLQQTAALRVVSLPAEQQAEIERQILAGSAPNAAVTNALAASKSKSPEPEPESEEPESPEVAYSQLIGFLEEWLPDLTSNEQLLAGESGVTFSRSLAILEQGRDFLNRMLNYQREAQQLAIRERDALRAQYPNVSFEAAEIGHDGPSVATSSYMEPELK